MKQWLIKSPFKSRSWSEILINGLFKLYGIRNCQARNHIAKMRPGDKALFYHAAKGRLIYGIMKVACRAYQDPITKNPRWLAIEFKPAKTFINQITLKEIKQNPALSNIGLLKQPRLSVMPLTKKEFQIIEEMGDG